MEKEVWEVPGGTELVDGVNSKRHANKTAQKTDPQDGSWLCCFPLLQLSQHIIPQTTENKDFFFLFSLENFSRGQGKPMS